MGSIGFFIAAIFIFALGAAAGFGFYLYQRKWSGDTPSLFAPRPRRLAFVERTALMGGRKLLLVRRDDVEHLILIGGPVDLVVETGIRSEGIANSPVKEESYASLGGVQAAEPSAWPLSDSALHVEPISPAEPRLPLSPQVKPEAETLELTVTQEAKAAE